MHDLVKLLERAQKERRDATSASDASASGAKDSKEESGATGEIEDPTSSASATGAIGANDEKNLGRKPKNDYEPFVYEMIPTKKAKELRMDLNMLTIARRPFKLILNETIERAKEDKNADANGVASSAEIDDPRNSCWNCKIAAQEDNLCLCIGCKKVRRCGRTFNH